MNTVDAALGLAGPPKVFGLPLAYARGVLFLLGLFPLARWLWLAQSGGLGANPVEFLTRSAGTWTFVCLLITLANSPLRVMLRQPMLIRLRRMCGLYTFFYACLHMLTYVWWDQWFDVAGVLADIGERPFIALGFAAFVCLLPLAVTSTRGWMRRLGRSWTRLHRLIYLTGGLALLHFWLHRAGKNDFFEVYLFGGVLALLLGWRLWRWLIRWRRPAGRRAGAPALDAREVRRP